MMREASNAKAALAYAAREASLYQLDDRWFHRICQLQNGYRRTSSFHSLVLNDPTIASPVPETSGKRPLSIWMVPWQSLDLGMTGEEPTHAATTCRH